MTGKSKHGVWLRELFPFTFVIALWLIHITLGFLDKDPGRYALLPRSEEGLLGIFTAPLLHADFGHLFSNTIPLLVCGFLLFYFYRQIAWKVWIWSWVLTGILVWIVGRSSWHLGASGLVYGLTAFLFFSGVFRRHVRLMLISLLIVFLYGSFIWGVFPFDPSVSWESHLCGALTGVLTAWLFRKEGLQRQEHVWPEEEDDPEPVSDVQTDSFYTPPAAPNTTTTDLQQDFSHLLDDDGPKQVVDRYEEGTQTPFIYDYRPKNEGEKGDEGRTF
ncbi:MAG: rhomboid family intramembrane serine protease [Bacteroidia bacterium]